MFAQGPPRSASTGVRPFIAFAVLALALYSLLAHWEQRGTGGPMFQDPDDENAQTVFEINVSKGAAGGHENLGVITPGEELKYNPAKQPRRVVAHFMLGNTYPFTEEDWEKTFVLAQATGLDGLALNLGKEDWQLHQAKVAYNIAAKRFLETMRHGPRQRPLQLFLSLDMTVLPHVTMEDMHKLADEIQPLLLSPAYMTREGRPIISTFSGEHAFGKHGWRPFLDYINRKLHKKEVFFWPTFFNSPKTLLKNEVADGLFAWNSAWPMGDHTINMKADQPYLEADKPFMAAVSPLFYTHYGKTGDFPFNKNWIYRSDDLLYPNRWAQIISQPAHQAPEIVQVLSWNDYGESHNIAPVMGAEPGSYKWTHNMDHIAFREMTKYFITRWRDGAPEIFRNEITVWMWYRPHPKGYTVSHDSVGRPHNYVWAQDLINIMVLVPEGVEHPVLEVMNGHGNKIHRTFKLFAGHANGVKVGFVPGQVSFIVRSKKGIHVRARGKPIMKYSETTHYNFNMWSRSWHIKPDHVVGPGAGQRPPHGRPPHIPTTTHAVVVPSHTAAFKEPTEHKGTDAEDVPETTDHKDQEFGHGDAEGDNKSPDLKADPDADTDADLHNLKSDPNGGLDTHRPDFRPEEPSADLKEDLEDLDMHNDVVSDASGKSTGSHGVVGPAAGAGGSHGAGAE